MDFARRLFLRKEEDKEEPKVPKGFEKFLKGSKKGEEQVADQNKPNKDLKKD